MNKKDNSRSKLTKMIFRETLISMVKEGHSIDSISVSDICKRSNLNRGTFYIHYSIPRDILNELEDETLKKFKDYIGKAKREAKDQIVLLVKYIRENSDAFDVLLLSTGDVRFKESIIKLTIDEMSELDGIICDIRFTPFLYDYMIYGCESMLKRWIKSSFPIDDETFASLIYDLCKASILKLYKK